MDTQSGTIIIDLNGARYGIEVDTTDTIGTLKSKACAVSNTTVTQVRSLIFEGERLDNDSRTLAECSITTPARVYMVR